MTPKGVVSVLCHSREVGLKLMDVAHRRLFKACRVGSLVVHYAQSSSLARLAL